MQEYNIWFSRLKLENKLKLKLLERFKSVEKIFKLTDKDLKNINLKDNIISELLNENYKKNLEKEELYMNKNKIQIVNCKEEAYPSNLKKIYDKPAIIYIRGKKELLQESNIAIIGTRKPTEYGKKVAISISKDLSDRNICGVSGLAIRYR